MKPRILIAAGTTALLAATPLLAATQAQVATDLNLRAGPGPNFLIEGTLPAEAQVELLGCVEGGAWCEVTYEGQTGYAYAPYLVVTEEETLTPVTEIRTTTVETVNYDDNGEEALIGGAVGAGIGSALIGGPAAIIGGLLVGSLAGSVADPETETITYVETNPVEPIFIQGEPIIGAVIPEEVVLNPVPDSTFLYTNLNGQPVIVNSEDRQIVYIVR